MPWLCAVGMVEKAHDSFEEAFKDFHTRVLAQKPLSEQFLTACWIEDLTHPALWGFNEVVRMAHTAGLLKEGKPTW